MTPDELYLWRIGHNLRQVDLANLLGIGSLTISRWERGVQKMPGYVTFALRSLEHRLAPTPTPSPFAARPRPVSIPPRKPGRPRKPAPPAPAT